MSDTSEDQTVPGQEPLDGMPGGELPPPPEIDGASPDAPYGYTRDGKPRVRRPRGSGRKPRTRRADAPPPPPRGPGRPAGTGTTRKTKTDYRPALNGLLQIVALPVAFVAPLDAGAIAVHGPGVTEALNTLAQERPEVAAALERILQVGPYGLVIAASLPLFAQIAANHNALPLPLAQSLGALPPAEFVAMVESLNGAHSDVRVPA